MNNEDQNDLFGDELATNYMEDDYYAFLNVRREATNEEISNAYRRLSLVYHPDKHVDPTLKKDAEAVFNKLKKVHEVLSDPHKRAIYDNLGVKGLNTDGWQLIARTRTPQEIRDEYERLAKERAEKRLQQQTNPKGSFTMSIRAVELFNPVDDLLDEFDDEPVSIFSSVEVSGISFSQSVDFPLTVNNTVTLGGNLTTQNGNGAGAVNLSCRHVLSEKSYLELDVGVGNGPVFQLKGSRTLTRHIFCNAGVMTSSFSNRGVKLGAYGTVAIQLDKHMIGYLTYRVGYQSSVTVTVIRTSESSTFNCSAVVGIPHSYVALAYTRKMLHRQLNLRLAVKYGTFGGIIEYGAEKRLSPQNVINATVSLGIPVGVILKLKLTRGNQTYSFPIHLCEEIIPAPVFYATVTPLLVYAAVKKLIIEPYAKERKRQAQQKQKEENRAKILERRKDAVMAVRLMEATYERVHREEVQRNGLVIKTAFYGKEEDVRREIERNERENVDPFVVDVVVPLQCLVKDSRLVLQEIPKSQLPGFYDPAIGEEKILYICYEYHTKLHKVTISDKESLKIPHTSHCVARE